MIITFVGDPRGRDPRFMARHKTFRADDPPHIDLYGISFPLNQPVSVPDASEWAAQHGAKLRGNSHFDVSDEGAAQAVSSAGIEGQRDVSEPDAPPEEPRGGLSQLDHDGDGEPGGSLPAEERGEDIEKLRADLNDLGVKPDMRWGPKRLQSEIDKALNG